MQLRQTSRSEISTKKAHSKKKKAANLMERLQFLKSVRDLAEYQADRSSKRAKQYEAKGNIEWASQSRDWSRRQTYRMQCYNRQIDCVLKQIEELLLPDSVRLKKKNYVLDIMRDPPSDYSDQDK